MDFSKFAEYPYEKAVMEVNKFFILPNVLIVYILSSLVWLIVGMILVNRKARGTFMKIYLIITIIIGLVVILPILLMPTTINSIIHSIFFT